MRALIGLRLPAQTQIILAEIDRIGIDEPLSKEKLCPVLGFLRVPHAQAGITQARALIRLSGAGQHQRVGLRRRQRLGGEGPQAAHHERQVERRRRARRPRHPPFLHPPTGRGTRPTT